MSVRFNVLLFLNYWFSGETIYSEHGHLLSSIIYYLVFVNISLLTARYWFSGETIYPEHGHLLSPGNVRTAGLVRRAGELRGPQPLRHHALRHGGTASSESYQVAIVIII